MICPRHKRLIATCAGYSHRAYSKDIDGIFLEDPKTDCQAFVAVDGEDIVVTGQGTTTLKDWAIDFQIYRTSVDYLGDTLVHAGFVKAYNGVREDVHRQIESLLADEARAVSRIVCTGHSLFGAIATIAALDCALRYELPVACVTFGSPRVGSRGFAKMFNDNVDCSFRCVRGKDPVTFTPLPLRFRHVRGGIHFGDRISSTVSLHNFCGCKVSDHSMEDYFAYITGQIETR